MGVLACTASMHAPEALFTYATSPASAQVPSLLHTPDEHCECATHLPHVMAVVSQTGVGFLQSIEVKQATHWPVGALQRGVAGLWATHWASSPESMQARQRWTAQMGATSLHSADEEQNMSGPACIMSPSPCMSPAMMQLWCATSQNEYGA